MANNFIPASEFLADKKKTVEEDLRNAHPLVIASTKEGIVLITENPTLSKKTAEVYDRIAFGAIGKYVKFEKLRKILVRKAIAIGANYAREDVRIESLAKILGETLDEVYSSSLYKVLPWSVEIALAEVNSKPDYDKIVVVLFNGVFSYKYQPYVIVGRNEILKAKIDELTREKKFKDMSFKEAIGLLKQAIAAIREQEENSDGKKKKKKNTGLDIKFEIAILRRNKPGRKFERVTKEGT